MEAEDPSEQFIKSPLTCEMRGYHKWFSTKRFSTDSLNLTVKILFTMRLQMRWI